MKVLWFALVLNLTLGSVSFAESEHHTDLSAGHGSGKVFPAAVNDLENSKIPEAVELIEPAFSATLSQEATLKWKEAKDAENYHVQVATDPNFKWLVADEHLYKGTSFQVKNLEAGLHYYWRVAASNQTKWAGSTHGYFSKSMFETK